MTGAMATDIPPERAETLAMIWPSQAPLPEPARLPRGVGLRLGVDHAAFVAVQDTISFSVTASAWAGLLERLAAGAMIFAEITETGEPIAVAAAEHRDGGWVEPGWVAVAPAHRGLGLGLAVCTALTRHLLTSGHRHLVGSTQDHRLAALRIYFTLGFRPAYRPEKAERWRTVCRQLEWPYREGWAWPS